MLSIKELHVYYGGIHALKGVSLEVPQGKIVTLIGANGAGKSTLLRTVCNLVPSKSGEVNFQGHSLVRTPTHQIVKKGIALVPEGRRIFSNLSVYENLRLGAYGRTDDAEIEKDLEWVYELFPRMRERKSQRAGTLSGGEQQMLAVGRGLMTRPALIMLDEPSLGLAPILVDEIFTIIQEIHKQGLTILLIEQNALAALKIADFGYVLETGNVVLSGDGEELLHSEDVRKAYLG
ncbi:ABC transporter ATP-binding protein [candidate division KSB3 bacterium]|uniref:ABC transporter ATP-binding protein n=1 Tax=candidate division KSB3 bacterium TaxID=2044937 RepID=A0A2G6E1T6_9BACT|nr:MAG: ABC transporter ATP-binding protein [candidate division KSB3 bacterium]